MFITSGFVEVNPEGNIEQLIEEMNKIGFEITDQKDQKIVFLLEKPKAEEIKRTMECLKSTDTVSNVYISYFSTEDADQGDDLEVLSLSIRSDS